MENMSACVCLTSGAKNYYKRKRPIITYQSLSILCYQVRLFCDKILECRTHDEVAGVTADGSFILSPEERPVVIVLEVIRMSEENARSDVTRDE